MTGVRRVLEPAARGLGWATATAVAYLLAIAGAAAGRRRTPPPQPRTGPRLRLLVLIPAHDEETTLPGTLAALQEVDYPSELVRVVVVADNCADATADVATRHGAEVLERRSGLRGKGPALAWALERIGEGRSDHDAVVFLDADCAPSPNLLTALERRLCAGTQAVQAAYTVANPAASHAAALRYAGFALINTVRPWGKDALGLSAGILGSGFAIERGLLDRHGWSAFSLTEDTEYHLQLLAAGVPVRFAPEAFVTSAMPTSFNASRIQQSRWKAGKLEILRRWLPQLVVTGLRRRDVRLLHAAFEWLVPSQSALAGSAALVVVAGGVLRSRAVVRLGLASVAGQILYVFGGLRLVQAPPAVYRALASAPLLVAWRLWLSVTLVVRGRPRGWQRTGR